MGKCPERLSLSSGVVAHIRRPTPPSLDALAADATEDSGDCSQPRQVPVRRTFIEYGCTCQSPSIAITPKAANTAPAALGISMRTAFDFWKEDVCIFVRNEHSLSGQDLTFVSGPPSSTSSAAGRNAVTTTSCCPQDRASPRLVPGFLPDLTPNTTCDSNVSVTRQKLPTVLYHLTPTSAKAAGFWKRTASEVMSPKRKGSSQATSVQVYADTVINMAFEAQVETGIDAASICSTDDGDSDDDFDLGICPQYSETVTPPSVGSMAHGDGTCKRCCFYPKGRCNNAESCQFCHFAHEKRKTKNKKKTKKRRRGRRGSDHTCNPVIPGPQGHGYVFVGQQLVFVPSSLTAIATMPSSVCT